MPNQYFDVAIISRGGGHRSRSVVGASAYRSGTKVAALAAAGMMSMTSVVASAAYRSGEPLYDVQADKVFDYQRKEDVIHQEILVPDGAPVWASNRELLWNHVSKIERRIDSQLARDIIAALPRELNKEQQIDLVHEFVQTQFVAKGMVADIAIHDKEASDGGRQPHAHVMLTMREISVDGFGKKNRDWNKQTLVSEWRDAWEQITNRHLEAAGRTERVSLRSYKEQGIDKIPGEHMGYEQWHLEQKGNETQRGDKNREIDHDNTMRALARDYAPPEAADSSEHYDDAAIDHTRVDAGLVNASALEQINTDDGNLSGNGKEKANRQQAKPDALLTSMVGKASSGAVGGQQGDVDSNLEAMHRADLRMAVGGLLRQSAYHVAEQISRLRAYSQRLLERTIGVARSVFDHYAGNAMRQHEQRRHRGEDLER